MGKQRILTKEEKEQIVYLYTVEKRGQVYCGKAVGTSDRKVKEVLREYNIKIRNYSEAAYYSNKNRTLFKNQEYFDIESHNMAWLLGFIASDGSISLKTNTIKISLSTKDREILEKIKEEVEIENKIRDFTTADGFDCSSVEWTCEKHKNKLKEYNIIPQKTFKLLPPYKLNKKYWIDYIRGYFDGDGSVNLIQGKNLRWQVCSATKPILEFIIEAFFEQYNIPKVNIQVQQRVHPLYYIQYSTNSTKKIYDILYTPNSLYLKRKKEHFDEIVK